jgi:putative transposase
VVFEEIDDSLWELIQPYLPPEKPKTGRPRSNLRQLFNGILYALKTGCAWANVPRVYGTKSTIHRFHLELCRKGIYKKIFDIMLPRGYDLEKIDISYCCIDTKSIKAKKGRCRI